MDRQPPHLAAVRERRLAAIGLPVRVGDERHCRVERQTRRQAGELLRIERQPVLIPQHQIQHHEVDRLQRDQRDRIGLPAHLLARIHAGQPVEPPLHRPQHRRQEIPPALHDGGDVAAQRHRRREHQREHERDLRPADHCHRTVLKIFWSDERPDQVQQKSRGNRATQDEIEHRLDPLAQSGISRHEQNTASPEDQHNNVGHLGPFRDQPRRILEIPDEISMSTAGLLHKEAIKICTFDPTARLTRCHHHPPLAVRQ